MLDVAVLQIGISLPLQPLASRINWCTVLDASVFTHFHALIQLLATFQHFLSHSQWVGDVFLHLLEWCPSKFLVTVVVE